MHNVPQYGNNHVIIVIIRKIEHLQDNDNDLSAEKICGTYLRNLRYKTVGFMVTVLPDCTIAPGVFLFGSRAMFHIVASCEANPAPAATWDPSTVL